MTVNTPGPLERASRLWRIEEPEAQSTDGPLALFRLVGRLAWRHKTRLVACVAAGAISAWFYAQSVPFAYSASATLLLEPRQTVFTGHEGAPSNLDLNSADSQLQIIRSERLLSAVFKSLDLQNEPELGPEPSTASNTPLSTNLDPLPVAADKSSKTPSKTSRALAETGVGVPSYEKVTEYRAAFANFVQRLRARRVGQSYVVEIEYTSSNPFLAARVANAIASGYLLQSVAFKEELARAGAETLQGRLDSLAAQVSAAKDAMEDGRLPSVATPDADARVVGAALPPLSPSSPRSMLITALGAVIGLLCGMASIALAAAFDRRIRDPDDLKGETTIPFFVVVPDIGRRIVSAWREQQANKKYLAAIRDLRTSIDLACAPQRGERNIVIALVAPTNGVGVSTLCLSLAQLLERGGRHVTLFQTNADESEELYWPAMSLMDAALTGENFDLLPSHHVDGVSVFPIHSKDPQANLYGDLRHPRVLRLLDAARAKGDVVLDLPALSVSMDALALAVHADAALLVVRAGQTRVEEVANAEVRLRRAGANVIGAILNKARA
ncbi:lipopolysaccharide biosynthesis protein [Rhizobium sp. CF080]|uniref:Wzz/FepE/Etk N-terminal domain-containing protein n=1 Tax=Rhizobium sp. (strain CF080) TaxID=1144310 RepID=UPI0002715E4C|nr:Wzz/FepE/Etk N-terminal domain-containing protein [Rhizobium sp. CF080]EUB99545.1 lipopolysaccharide biosynthesis protein [Rhizobium sp. CF080]